MAAKELPESSAKPARWFCRLDGKEVGPVTDKDLRQLAGSGKLTQAAHVRLGATGAWVPAAKVKGLFAATAEAAKAPASSSAATIVEQSDPIADLGDSAINHVDPVLVNVPYLEFARPAAGASASAMLADSSVNSAVAESPKLPPPRSPYLPPLPTAAAQELVSNSTDGRTRNVKILWAAVAGGSLLLVLIGVGVVWMLSGEETTVAEAAAPREPPRAAIASDSELPVKTKDDAVHESAVAAEGSAIDPFAEPAISEPMVTEGGEEVSSEPTENADSLLTQPTEALSPQPEIATTAAA
ncbi:MAG: DUF4339 domain-containing protein, partial [Planctomycetota bacterium]